jgi:hypothetical protein
MASLGRLELPLLAPEASALSTELQGQYKMTNELIQNPVLFYHENLPKKIAPLWDFP